MLNITQETNTGHVTCPQARRVKNRRSDQQKWRSGKKWKAIVEEHAHVPEAFCVHCLKHHGDKRAPKKKNGKWVEVLVYLTINHLSRRLYETEESYTTWDSEYMEICCTVCNWMYEKGKESCPVCHNAYIHVMEPDHMCQSCYEKLHPEIKEKRLNRKTLFELKKVLFKEAKAAERKELARKNKLNKSRNPTTNNNHSRTKNKK